MNALLTPPPERDLPDHAGLRRRIVHATAPRRRRAGRLVPVAVAAAVLLVVGLGVGVAARLGAAGTGSAGPPTDRVPQPSDALVRDCLAPGGGVSGIPGPPDSAGAHELARLYDAAGAMLAVGRTGRGGGVATCDLDRDGRLPGGGLVTSTLAPWARFDPSRQAVVVDLAEDRVAVVGTSTSSPDAPAIHDVVGRVAPGVARVEVRWSDGHSAAATLHAGVYAAREVVRWDGRNVPLLLVTVRAYDAGGRLLGTAHGSSILPTDTALPTRTSGR